MIPEEARRLIGKVDPPYVREVEGGAVRRYADAVGNGNPLYQDEDCAKKTRYGGLIAPPGFFGWPVKTEPQSESVLAAMAAVEKAGYHRLLDGGIVYDFLRPVRVGDRLIVYMKVKDIVERESKGGTMIVMELEANYLNEKGDLVARSCQTLIRR
jgi:acyl dehydratase